MTLLDAVDHDASTAVAPSVESVRAGPAALGGASLSSCASPPSRDVLSGIV